MAQIASLFLHIEHLFLPHFAHGFPLSRSLFPSLRCSPCPPSALHAAAALSRHPPRVPEICSVLPSADAPVRRLSHDFGRRREEATLAAGRRVPPHLCSVLSPSTTSTAAAWRLASPLSPRRLRFNPGQRRPGRRLGDPSISLAPPPSSSTTTPRLRPRPPRPPVSTDRSITSPSVDVKFSLKQEIQIAVIYLSAQLIFQTKNFF